MVGSSLAGIVYDAQYTSSDTGLIYMRNRVYDPATAQFLSRDPLEAITGEPYSYALDNPVNKSDPDGLGTVEAIVAGCVEEPEGVRGAWRRRPDRRRHRWQASDRRSS
jgi:RHS repeat-associated protein